LQAVYTGSQKRRHNNIWPYSYQILNNFWNSFTSILTANYFFYKAVESTYQRSLHTSNIKQWICIQSATAVIINTAVQIWNAYISQANEATSFRFDGIFLSQLHLNFLVK